MAALIFAVGCVAVGAGASDEFAVSLPEGTRAVWSLDAAYREPTPTRERVCLNGLWRWQPAAMESDQPPVEAWGYFKVPGCWPGITDYMQKESQTVHAHPAWKDVRLGELKSAWYEREFTVPEGWSGRRIALDARYLNSFASVFVDGVRVGEIRFPGGSLDLGTACRPGTTQRLSLLVVAMPLKGVLQSFTDSASAREVKGSVARRGLCGDVFLVSEPAGPRIQNVEVATSVRSGELRLGAAMENLASGRRYRLHARVTEPGGKKREFDSRPFGSGDVASGGQMTFTNRWVPGRLWDLHTPGNQCELELALRDADGAVCDVMWKRRFGFREFWIQGRDFYLNGSRVFLSAVPLDNAEVSAVSATYAAARESFERLKSLGINFVYTHNYGCEPGSHLGFDEILRAADDAGVLVALSQPHFSHYDWQSAAADRDNGYERHAEFYVQVAGSHPSVVMYAMSHNATGYNEDMNPDLIDGVREARDTWALRNVKLAERAEAIVRGLDPARIIYHHASGNLGPMHPVNFYPNFAPIQELSDWFEHWSTVGVKPVFLCEYGAPFTWDWTMYRGWYQGKREFGSARVPWEFCLAEWNAQFLGDRAFPASELEKANLRWEAGQFRAGNVWHRWDYPTDVGSTRLEERYPVFAAYLTDNWRAFRTWGVSATSPWEHGHFWKLRDGVARGRRTLPVDWDRLQTPGFSPDYIDQRYERMDLAYDRQDWVPTAAAEALMRNNRPLLAYLAGPAAALTAKDHNFVPGQTVEKTVVILNNSRATSAFEARWSLALPKVLTGKKRGKVRTGEQARLPLRFELPGSLAPGSYPLRLRVAFGEGAEQEDEFRVDIVAPVAGGGGQGLDLAVFDQPGETTAELRRLGIEFRAIDARARVLAPAVLVIGKGALTIDGEVPDLQGVREGLRVIVFEQTAEVLEKRLGFRVAEYGLRQVFPRVANHPVLTGLSADLLRDWCGAATLAQPRLKYETGSKFNGAPVVSWCGLPVTRVWRCGNWGNVASVLIEKPVAGGFLPVVDGGYSLQYSPLLEFTEGKGRVVFCQLDVTGRTEPDPVADGIMRRLVSYIAGSESAPRRHAVYVGEPAGRSHLASMGVNAAAFQGSLLANDLLVVGLGGLKELADNTTEVNQWVVAGGHLVAIGLDQAELAALPALQARTTQREHISTGFGLFDAGTMFAGIGPADVHIRDPRFLPLVTGGVRAVGDGVLAEQPGVAYCQLVPWRFASAEQMNLRRTHRRVSFALGRILANLGVAGNTPLLKRLMTPVEPSKPEQRWLQGFYLDQPQEWDDPYRFFRW